MIRISTVVTLALLVLMPGARAFESERYIALAVNMGTPGPSGSGTIEMAIDRWSTDAERERLRTTLVEKGPEKLLEELKKVPRVGYIRTPNSVGYDLHYAYKTPGQDGGERVVIATDRYIGLWEATNRPRRFDYPFTVIEMRIRPDGQGEGKLSLATKITAESNQIVLEDYASQPVLLTSVHKETSKK